MDQVRREIEIKAPIARVWTLLTEPEHLQVWYAFDGAAVDLRLDGVIEHRWAEHGHYRGVIDVLEPPHRLGYHYANVPDELPAPGRSTHVLFELAALEPGHTRVTVTESGISRLAISEQEREAYREATIQGWDGGLPALADYAGR